VRNAYITNNINTLRIKLKHALSAMHGKLTLREQELVANITRTMQALITIKMLLLCRSTCKK
jgi:hypothetical protein